VDGKDGWIGRPDGGQKLGENADYFLYWPEIDIIGAELTSGGCKDKSLEVTIDDFWSYRSFHGVFLGSYD
jgi:hypothetical protein